MKLGIIAENIIREYLNEDMSLARKILKQNNIPEDDENFLELKNYLLKNNAIAYIGFILKFFINLYETVNFNRRGLLEIADFILDNKEFLKKLPKQLSQYDYYYMLIDDIHDVKAQATIKKLTNKLTNKKLANEINNVWEILKNEAEDEWHDIKYFLDISSSDQKEFLKRTDAFNYVNEFFAKLKEFNEDHKLGFNYGRVLSEIKSMSDNDIKILYAGNNMILCLIKTFEASQKIGSKSWCIVGDESQFKNYTKNGEYFQYFFFNFNPDVPANLKMIGFTLIENNNVRASQDRYNNNFGGLFKYLKSIGIKEKIFKINDRMRLGRRIENELNSDEIRSNMVFVKRTPTDSIIPPKKEVINRLAHKIGEHLRQTIASGKPNDVVFKNLDIILNKYQNYPSFIDEKTEKGYWVSKFYKNFNIFAHFIDNYDEIKNSYEKSHEENYAIGLITKYELENSGHLLINKEEFIEILKKIYLSSIKLHDDTIRSLLTFLKENNVDILKLSQIKKGKLNKELDATEFAMLNKKGANLKPIIQNKLAAIRRGEDVNMNQSEVMYAIDNGFKNIIMKYYKNMLPDFRENQLSYEDLNIYKKLGLVDDVSKVIDSKAKIYGLDSLNSIERSLYDVSNRKQNNN